MAQQDLVRRWLRGRQSIIVELVGLTQEVGTAAPGDESLRLRLQRFCADVVDYVSAGHFEIYSCLVDTAEAAALFARLRTKLQLTTDRVLAFNDRIARKRPDLARLRQLLADVGIALEERLALEDRLIAAARVIANARTAARPTAFAAAP